MQWTELSWVQLAAHVNFRFNFLVIFLLGTPSFTDHHVLGKNRLGLGTCALIPK